MEFLIIRVLNNQHRTSVAPKAGRHIGDGSSNLVEIVEMSAIVISGRSFRGMSSQCL